jgi:hypothetical protein
MLKNKILKNKNFMILSVIIVIVISIFTWIFISNIYQNNWSLQNFAAGKIKAKNIWIVWVDYYFKEELKIRDEKNLKEVQNSIQWLDLKKYKEWQDFANKFSTYSGTEYSWEISSNTISSSSWQLLNNKSLPVLEGSGSITKWSGMVEKIWINIESTGGESAVTSSWRLENSSTWLMKLPTITNK